MQKSVAQTTWTLTPGSNKLNDTPTLMVEARALPTDTNGDPNKLIQALVYHFFMKCDGGKRQNPVFALEHKRSDISESYSLYVNFRIDDEKPDATEFLEFNAGVMARGLEADFWLRGAPRLPDPVLRHASKSHPELPTRRLLLVDLNDRLTVDFDFGALTAPQREAITRICLTSP